MNKKIFEENASKFHKVSQDDIIVYKIGTVEENKFLPYFMDDVFYYKPKLLNEEIKLFKIYDETLIGYGPQVEIEEGYHSYSGECYYLTRADNVFFINSKSAIDDELGGYRNPNELSLGKFIIPKETEYYENKDGELVSSQLIWTGESIPLQKFENVTIDDHLMLKDIIFNNI